MQFEIKNDDGSRHVLSFDVSREVHDGILAVIRRAERSGLLFRAYANESDPKTNCLMDMTACHANGCPVRWDLMLAGPDLDFTHDFCGIHRHIDRTTGKLGDGFSPRYAEAYHGRRL